MRLFQHRRFRRKTLWSATMLLGVLCVCPTPASEEDPRLESDPVLSFEETVIPMADGESLSVDLYLPRNLPRDLHRNLPKDLPRDLARNLPRGVAKGVERLPVLLEYLPYRKQESRAYRWDVYRYFVARGYVVARVDIRGTGSSTGRLPDYEYSEVEQDDAETVIHWLAEQPWSNGRVGMFGISWGGFNAIHLGMRAPKPLKAILAACATDDLFYDDVHYLDGLMHVDQYEINQDLANAVVATPELVLDELSLQNRFDTKPWFLTKLENPNDGPFWNRGSLIEDYSQLKVPAFLIGGFLDGYRDSIPRMVQNTDVDIEAILGPWPHLFPHDASPGPAVEWRDRAVKFFDRYLKPEAANEVTQGADPKKRPRKEFTYYLRKWTPPGKSIETVPGEWRTLPVSIPGQPANLPDRIQFSLRPSGLVEESPAKAATMQAATMQARTVPASTEVDAAQSVWAELPYHATVGHEAGSWWGDLQVDQQPLDDASLVFETEPLEKAIEIVGFPQAKLSVLAPESNWFVRLSDVAPPSGNEPSSVDGRETVTLVTGAANALPRSRNGEKPRDVEVELHFTSWVFEPGHRIRISISNAQWPMVWPTGERMTTQVAMDGSSTFELPIAPPRQTGRDLPQPFAKPAPPVPYPITAPHPEPQVAGAAPDDDSDPGVSWPGEWQTTLDRVKGVRSTRWQGGYTSHFDWTPTWDRVQRGHTEKIDYTASDRNPWAASITAHTTTSFEVERDGRTSHLEWVAEFEMKSTRRHYRYKYIRKLFVDGKLKRKRSWRHRLAR